MIVTCEKRKQINQGVVADQDNLMAHFTVQLKAWLFTHNAIYSSQLVRFYSNPIST
jgi:hypothetical protein